MSGPFFLPFDSVRFTMLVFVCKRSGSYLLAGLNSGCATAKQTPNGAARFLIICDVRRAARFLEPSRISTWPAFILNTARQVSVGSGSGPTASVPLGGIGPQRFPYGS